MFAGAEGGGLGRRPGKIEARKAKEERAREEKKQKVDKGRQVC